jgi:hypothetical protein
MERHLDPYPAAIAHALQRHVGGSRQAVKTVMRWTGAGERTVKNWLSGHSGPSGRHLAALARHSDEVLAAFLGLAGRQQLNTGTRITRLRNKVAAILEDLDFMIGGEK